MPKCAAHSLFHKKLSVVFKFARFATMHGLEAPKAADDTPPYTTTHGTYVASTTHANFICGGGYVHKFLFHFVAVQTPTWELA